MVTEAASCCSRETAIAAFVLATWMVLNLGLNFFNKYVLSPEPKKGLGFTFPVFFSTFHMVASFLGTNLIFALRPELNTLSRQQFAGHRLQIISLSLLFVLNITCNNASLVHLGLSVNQIIKSVCPLPTMVFSYFIERKRYSWPLVTAVLVLVVGAVMAVPFGNPSATPFGLLLATTSMLATSTKPVMAAVLMKEVEHTGLSPLVLVWYDSLISFFVMSFMWCVSNERRASIEYLHLKPRVSLYVILIGSSLAFCYNISSFYLTKVTSALTLTIAANVKIVGLIVVAATFVDHIDYWLNWLGIAIFFLATFAYSYISFRGKQQAAADAAAAKAAAAEEGTANHSTSVIAQSKTSKSAPSNAETTPLVKK